MAFTNRMFQLIEPFLQEVQDAEVAADELKLLRALVNSSGAQLDGWGVILDLDRAGRDDINYRIALQAKILVHGGHGVPEIVIGFVKSITNANNVSYIEVFPAAVRILTDGDATPSLMSNLVSVVEAILPAGVKLQALVFVNDALSPFNHDDEGSPLVVSDGDGFLEDDGTGTAYPEIPNGYTAGAYTELAQ